jgi:hypothetical protein
VNEPVALQEYLEREVAAATDNPEYIPLKPNCKLMLCLSNLLPITFENGVM